MTEAQFECCIVNRSGSVSEAARLVLVHGMAVKEVAIKTGHAEQSIRNAIGRIRKRFKTICKAGPWPVLPADDQ